MFKEETRVRGWKGNQEEVEEVTQFSTFYFVCRSLAICSQYGYFVSFYSAMLCYNFTRNYIKPKNVIFKPHPSMPLESVDLSGTFLIVRARCRVLESDNSPVGLSEYHLHLVISIIIFNVLVDDST